MDIPSRTVERISAYRRILLSVQNSGQQRIFSHELAGLEGVTAAQVRRDLMTIGYTGSPAHGYEVGGLIEKISSILDPSDSEVIALVGVGHLGSALLAYFQQRWPNVFSAVAFEADPELTGRKLHGCDCFSIEELETVVQERRVNVAILAVPAAAAQDVADRLINSGVRGLVNFAPVRLRVPADIYMDNVDISVSIEKAAYFARQQGEAQTINPTPLSQ